MDQLSKYKAREVGRDAKSGFLKYTHLDMWFDFVKEYISENPTSYATKGKKKMTSVIFKKVPSAVTSTGTKLESILTSETHLKILESYNTKKQNSAINGEVVSLMVGLGNIRLTRKKATEKGGFNLEFFKETGIKVPVDIPYFPWIFWRKSRSIKNETVYVFEPARANSTSGRGFSTRVWAAFRANPFILNKYPNLMYGYKIVKNTES